MTENQALFQFLLRMGDSALILGHRVSEWCGHGPYLEEDIALANTALDLIGQATLWLELAGEVEDKGRSADDLAFLRDAYEFRNFLLVERPNQDFGLTIMRQFLYDAWSVPMLAALGKSSNPRVAEIAHKASKEVAYHLERSTDLCLRLGDGTEESHARMQAALDDLWAYTGELFQPDETTDILAQSGVAPSPDDLQEAWRDTVQSLETVGTLTIPDSTFSHAGGTAGTHSEHLGFLLAEMQWLQRAHPGATW